MMRRCGYAWRWTAAAAAAAIGCSGGGAPLKTDPEKSAAGGATAQASTPAAGTPAAGTSAAGTKSADSKAAATSTPTPAPATTASPAAAAAPQAEAAAKGEALRFPLPEAAILIQMRPAAAAKVPYLVRNATAIFGGEAVKGLADPAFMPDRARRIPVRAAQVLDLCVYFDGKPSGSRPSSFLVVMQTLEPKSPAEAAEMFDMRDGEEVEVEGRKVLAYAPSAGVFDSVVSIHQADPKTFLLGPQTAILKALAAGPAKGPLAERAAQGAFAGQVRIVAAKGDRQILLDRGAAALAEQTLVEPYAKLVPLIPKLASASLELDVVGPELLVAEITMDDAAAGGAAKEALDEIWKEAKILVGLAAQQVEAAVGPAPAALLKEARGKVALTQAGATATVVLARPEKLEEVAQKALDDYVPKLLERQTANQTNVQKINNVRNVLLAMQQVQANEFRWPTDVVSPEGDGKVLASWRKSILPYVERGDLHRAMKHEEPWDSPHNKPLGDAQIKILSGPGGKKGLTSLFMFTGPGTIAPKPGSALGTSDVKDGASNTICLVFAKPELAAPYFQPRDLVFDPEKMDELLEALPEENVVVGYFDGHVEVWKKRPSAEVLKALVTIAGGETVEPPK